MLSAVCVLLVVVNVVQGDSGQTCSQHTPSRQVFSYTARPNQQGQWEAQLGFRREDVSNKSLPISLSVVQTHNKNCEGSHTLDIFVNITGRFAAGTTVNAKKPPPADYEFFPGHGWYKFHTQGAPWSAARDTCAAEGAHLLIPNSEDEVNDVIMKVYNKTSKKHITGDRNDAIWVGVMEDKSSGSKKYRTIFGDSLTVAGFDRWNAGQPNEDNACIWMYKEDWGLGDSLCSQEFPFLCEIEM